MATAQEAIHYNKEGNGTAAFDHAGAVPRKPYDYGSSFNWTL